ncbi:hypothetical protein [Thermocatellispora tengchongensis]|uniref:hypothetical protein n=1 Tax=Thermocatellispora tengchongensis TaxID=1073253 RepID=UPI00363E4C4A
MEARGLQGGGKGESMMAAPSARSTVSLPSAPSRTASASASTAGCTRSSSANDSRVLPPRSTYRIRCPSTSTTSAPALRPGLCATSPGWAGQGRAAPYGLAGSAAARTTTRRSSRFSGGGEAHRSSNSDGDGAAGADMARMRSTAPGSANWAPPSPSTKYPRRHRPLSSYARSTW